MKLSNQLRTLKLNHNSLFQVGYFLLIFNQVLAQSQFEQMRYPSLLLKAFRWIITVCFMVFIIKKGIYPYSKRSFFWLGFVMLSILEMICFNGKLLLIILFLTVISAYKTNLNSLINTHIKALLAGVIFVSLSSFIGILDILGEHKEFDNITGFLFKQDSIRYSFGFLNSNVIPLIFLFLYLYFLMVKKDKYKWYYDIFALAWNYIIFLLCGSRMCIVLLFFSVILRLLMSINKAYFVHIFTPGAFFLLGGCLIFSLILPRSALYGCPLVTIIDRALTARITIMKNILLKYPITLFGYGDLSINSAKEYLTMDNGYIALFVTRGLLIGIVFMCFLLMLIINSKKTKNPYLLLLVIIVILANIVDNSIVHYITFPLYILSFNGGYKNWYEQQNFDNCTSV